MAISASSGLTCSRIPRPLDPGHIGICEEALDAGRLQAALGEQRLGHIAELANRNEFRSLVTLHRTIIIDLNGPVR
jgi:hypothetical protein